MTVTLLHEGKKVAQKTTRVCYKTKNPYYDEELVFTTDLAIVEVCRCSVRSLRAVVDSKTRTLWETCSRSMASWRWRCTTFTGSCRAASGRCVSAHASSWASNEANRTRPLSSGWRCLRTRGRASCAGLSSTTQTSPASPPSTSELRFYLHRLTEHSALSRCVCSVFKRNPTSLLVDWQISLSLG